MSAQNRRRERGREKKRTDRKRREEKEDERIKASNLACEALSTRSLPRSADLGWFLLAWNAITEQGHFCERARYAAPPPLLERNEMLPTDPLIELSGVRKAVIVAQIR